MKNFFKVMRLVWIGLGVAIFVYPFLHETGHIMMGILTGERVVEVSVFPRPSVITSSSTQENAVIVGWSGILFPAIFAATLYPRQFGWWYAGLVLRLICLWSFVVSMLSVLCFVWGIPFSGDDITTLLMMECISWQRCFYVSIMCILAMSLSIFSISPIQKCRAYFGLG